MKGTQNNTRLIEFSMDELFKKINALEFNGIMILLEAEKSGKIGGTVMKIEIPGGINPYKKVKAISYNHRYLKEKGKTEMLRSNTSGMFLIAEDNGFRVSVEDAPVDDIKITGLQDLFVFPIAFIEDFPCHPEYKVAISLSKHNHSNLMMSLLREDGDSYRLCDIVSIPATKEDLETVMPVDLKGEEVSARVIYKDSFFLDVVFKEKNEDGDTCESYHTAYVPFF